MKTWQIHFPPFSYFLLHVSPHNRTHYKKSPLLTLLRSSRPNSTLLSQQVNLWPVEDWVIQYNRRVTAVIISSLPRFTIYFYHLGLKWPPSGWSHTCPGWDYWESNYTNPSCFKQTSKGISEVRFICYSRVRLSSVLVTVLPGLVRGEATLCHLVAHSAQDNSCFFPLWPSHAP